MAHQIYKKPLKEKCPRCSGAEARIATYHFGSTYIAECSECGFGNSNGCDEQMAMARLRGKILDSTPFLKSA